MSKKRRFPGWTFIYDFPLFSENGYLNMREIIHSPYTFIFCNGGRGTGKTYGALDTILNDWQGRFLHLRRTKIQADLISNPATNSWKEINEDQGRDIGVRKVNAYTSQYIDEEENCLGYTAALTTIANIRGVPLSDVNLMFYDEFVPEEHARPIRAEAKALWNAYETVNRNRELKGIAPAKMLCASNSDRAANPIYADLKIVNLAVYMSEHGISVAVNEEKSILLIVLSNSPISAKKANTALYKLTRETDYGHMAIENKFTDNCTRLIKSAPLMEYKPIASCGEICVYRHKSRQEYYVCQHKSGTVPVYAKDERSQKEFGIRHYYVWEAYLLGKCFFDSLETQTQFTCIFK